MGTEGVPASAAQNVIPGIDEERLIHIFSHLPGLLVVLSGPDHVFQFANEPYMKLVGGGRDVLGRPLAQVLPEIAEQGFVKLLDQVYATGEPFFGYEVPISYGRPDGESEEMFFNFVYLPTRNRDGQIDGILTHGVEVTDLVHSRNRFALQAESASDRARDEAQARIDQVLESAGDGICALDSEGRATLINPAAQRITGFSVEESLGKVFHDLVHEARADGESHPVDACAIQRSASGGKPCEVDDDVFSRKDGTTFPVSYRATPIHSDGECTGAVLVFRDLTEQRKLEAARRRAEEAEASRHQALQLNDDILQGLIVAKMAMELGDPAKAMSSLDATIDAMKLMINRLLSSSGGELRLEDTSLVRAAAAGTAAPKTDQPPGS